MVLIGWLDALSGLSIMTSTLDKLLTDASTREVVLQALKALEEGGAVITDSIKDRGNRKKMETALEEYGARYSSSRGYWKKKSSSDHSKSKRVKSSRESPINLKATEDQIISDSKVTATTTASSSSAQPVMANDQLSQQRRPVYGVALPPSTNSISPENDNNKDDDGDEAGPLPASHGNYRKPVSTNSSTDANVALDSKPRREEWMSQELKETDPTRLLRLKAMTSQAGRTFNNYKSATGEMVLPGADSRSTATGKIDDKMADTTTTQPKSEFHWNHEEMMGVDKVDKQRLNRVLSENINSRFAPASKKFL